MTVLFIKESPDPAEKPGRSFYALVAPIQIPLRRGSEKAKHPRCIRAIFLDQVFRIHHVLFGFGHLLEFADGDLATALPAAELPSPFPHLFREEITISGALIYLFANHPLCQ
jgi:hypothetical protein